MRTVSAGITAAQKAASADAYVVVTLSRPGDSTYRYIHSPTAAKRIKFIRHEETPYLTEAIVVLDNSDLSLTTDLSGYRIDIHYGYMVDGTGDVTGGKTASMWVKRQFHTSKMGSLDTVLHCAGAWNLLAEINTIASIIKEGAGENPYYEVDYAASSYTIYDIMQDILEASDCALFVLGSEDDSIIDTLTPDFVANALPYETSADMLYRLLMMTKVFMREERPTVPAIVDDNFASEGWGDAVVQVVTAGATRTYTKGTPQRSCFHWFDRDWIFYMDNTYIVYDSTDDLGASFKGATIVAPISAPGNQVSIWKELNNDYVLLVYTNVSSYVIFVRGLLAANGVITWDVDQNPWTSGDRNNPGICRDSKGYVWVITTDESDDSVTIKRSGNTDGTWGVTSIDHTLDSPGNQTNTSWGTVIPLSDGKVLAVWNTDGASLKVKSYDSGWGTERSSDKALQDPTKFSAVQSVTGGDDVDIVFFSDDFIDEGIWHIQYLYSTDNFGSETRILDDTNKTNLNPALTRLNSTGNLRVWYHFDENSPSSTFRYMDRIEGTWDTSVSLGRRDASGADNQCCSSSYIAFGGWALCCILETPSTNYNLMYVPLWAGRAKFRLLYPGGYGAFDYTYVSDNDGSNQQFREFNFADHPLIPTWVTVFGNQSEDGTWGNILIGDYEDNDAAADYMKVLRYTVASKLTTEGNLDNRAEAIALRHHMEESLGNLVARHTCDLELYDYVEVKDKRGTDSYTVYPTSQRSGRWNNKMVVGSIVHLFDPAKGVYNIQIGFNGINADLPNWKLRDVADVIEELPEEKEGEDIPAGIIPPVIPGPIIPVPGPTPSVTDPIEIFPIIPILPAPKPIEGTVPYPVRVPVTVQVPQLQPVSIGRPFPVPSPTRPPVGVLAPVPVPARRPGYAGQVQTPVRVQVPLPDVNWGRGTVRANPIPVLGIPFPAYGVGTAIRVAGQPVYSPLTQPTTTVASAGVPGYALPISQVAIIAALTAITALTAGLGGPITIPAIGGRLVPAAVRSTPIWGAGALF